MRFIWKKEEYDIQLLIIIYFNLHLSVIHCLVQLQVIRLYCIILTYYTSVT